MQDALQDALLINRPVGLNRCRADAEGIMLFLAVIDEVICVFCLEVRFIREI
jgi:hypothetical protein